MLKLLKRAVLPVLSLVNAIKQWKEIRHRLADTPRKRISQYEKNSFFIRLALMRLRRSDEHK